MKGFRLVVDSFALLAALCASSLAATRHVIVNNNNSLANSAILYRLNRSSGHLTKLVALKTGGQGTGAVGGDFSGVQEAVSADGR